ncbi:MAG: glutamate synthase subunit beta [Butyribacter sp.]|uniref:Glutamate synthase n=2 Tax=Butyribacter intestini TaxID=1703332 RepID=A0AAW3JWV8_9FIRM|nr:glutamate synthase subunit beta [Butyribacter intestini]KQC86755.1 glutamate synthase [Butyribacter intestini]MBS5363617.1 glutamate synthase subunit beta [Clostridium sp.]MCQ5165007.1 glutamate synthase subunit beta [Roseburia hominis]RHU77860.1 glutamate synthase subunit beta [Butyribacter intestini]
MGKPTGFLEYERKNNKAVEPLERIKNFNEFHTPMSDKDRKEQASRCMNCGVPFCQSGMMINGMASGCPLNNLVPEWNDLLYHGCMKEALQMLRQTNNFPEFTSRVCPALCEAACTCGLNDSPVTCKANENAIVEYGYANGLMEARKPKVRTGKKVAIIGSGPSGLAAADQLNRRGHDVTVFERNDHIGGLLMYGIPNMKLEKWVIDRKQKVMEEEGVKFVVNADVGKTVKAADIVKDYDSVILACGASNPRDIKATGREADGIYFAVDFLTRSTKHVLTGKKDGWVDTKGKNVVVIGGGDTGNDCVGTAVRQGAKSVVQIEMMPKLPDERAANNPWPEWPRVCKTDYGQEEAIAVFGKDPRIYQATVKEFIADKNGKLKKVKLVKLEPKKDAKTGRLNMVEIPGSEFEIPADYVLIAAGFLGTQDYVAKAFGVKLNARTNVETAEGSYKTSVDKVFTAGDMHRGQSLVVWGINEGRHVAREVDEFLMGYTNLP